MLLKESLSLFTVLLGIVFGVMTALHNVYNMQALSTGPMNITLMITTSSTIIPTLSGVFFAQGLVVVGLVGGIATLITICIMK